MTKDKLEHMFVEQLYLEQVFAVPSLLYVWVQCRMVCVSVPVYDGSVLIVSWAGYRYMRIRTIERAYVTLNEHT